MAEDRFQLRQGEQGGRAPAEIDRIESEGRPMSAADFDLAAQPPQEVLDQPGVGDGKEVAIGAPGQAERDVDIEAGRRGHICHHAITSPYRT